MRPVGEVREALLAAAVALATDEQAPTVRELAQKARVGQLAARRTIDNLRRAGLLHIPRMRKVDYRNCPVAEYACSKMATLKPADGWAAWRGVSICTPRAEAE
ncbi:hypothetical protein [Rhodoferax sp. WC2427]|uniref:hypothetical protein n=1 Tax=Rhodoferax sp. WC2427 TaxID=3234144 RepID=UPI003466E4B7